MDKTNRKSKVKILKDKAEKEYGEFVEKLAKTSKSTYFKGGKIV